MRLAVALVFLAACGGPSAPKQPLLSPPAPAPGPPVVQPAPPVAPVEPPPSDPRIAADLAAFDMVWQRVADTFYDPKYGGVDWKAVRTELRPKILTTKTREEARAIMNQATERLGKSHFGISGPLVEVEGEAASDDEAVTGIEVRIIGQSVIITRIETGSPAEKAKLKLGTELIAVDSVDLAARIKAVADKLGSSSLLPHYQIGAVQRLLDGKLGTKAVIDARTPGATSILKLAVERAQIGRVASLGNLGNQRIIYEARSLEKQVGYIRLSVFLDPATVNPAFSKDVASFKDAAGIIIDLRGNPGGIGGMAMGMAGYLVSDADKKLGTMRTRATSLDFVINPQAAPYKGKVAVLVDELSASTSEILAAGLKDIGRARVFGRRTPGAALPSTIEKLPNGDRFQYAIADYVSASGKILEGQGVTPDVPVALDLGLLRSGKDPDIVAATRWIKEKP